MNPAKKLFQILALIFFALSVASCDTGCVEADEFDVESLIIESNPVDDGVFGSYDAVSGGQRANWHSTDLLSNGDMFLIQIGGSWTPLQGTNQGALDALPRCNTCAKRYNNSTPNCICYKGQVPTPEKGIDGRFLNVDCTQAQNQEDPTKCSCTKQHGLATDYGVYHFPLNILDKNESLKLADNQTNCKYDRGMGAYIALWGGRGATVPVRAYHLFSEEEICNVMRDSNGRCLDPSGNDATKYIFRSANSRIFMKDDGDNNQGDDTDTSDDIYHKPNEEVKTIMWDTYYSDNYGQYNVRILRGVGNKSDTGILEFLVGNVEDVLLGPMDDNGVRHGSIIEFMYKAIIQDSGFVLVVQVSLALYIALFGAAHLFGVAEIMSKKELMNRVLKIGLIVFFISPQSWYFYNKIVVAFFKDSMDFIVATLMDMYDSNIGQTSMIKIAQMDRVRDASQATRFSYPDLIIKSLMSSAVTKKIFGLFFQSIFGFLYIPLIYVLIFSFIYVMLYVASMYIVNLIKIIFVLSLGPIFMVFTLFSKTAGMFKNWLSFLGSRALEIIVIFLVLYMFLTILDKNFTDLLYYRVCGETKSLGFFTMTILISDIDRSFVTWMSKFIATGGLIFICYLIIQKVPSVTGSIVSVAGVASSGGGFDMAGKALGAGFDLAKGGAGALGSVAATAARYGVRGATLAARRAGLADFANGITDKIPVRISPRTLWRDAVIDGAIKKAQAAAGGRTGKERDAFIRDTARKELEILRYKEPNKMGLLGVDNHNIAARFDKLLVKDPLKNFIKEEAKRQKNMAPNDLKFGKDAQDAIRAKALEWADKNLYDGARDVVQNYFDNSKGINNLAKEKAELSSSRAARLMAGNEDAKNRYLRHLHDKEFEHRGDWKISKFFHGLIRDRHNNPKQMASSFLRKADREERGVSFWNQGNPFQSINFFDKNFINRDAINKMTADAQNKMLADALLQGKAGDKERMQFMRDKMAKNARNSLEDSPTVATRNRILDEMKSANAQGLFEKTAQIAALNTRFSRNADFRAEHRSIMEGYINKQLELAKKMSNEDALAERARIAGLAKLAGINSSFASFDQSLIDQMTTQNALLTNEVNRFDTLTDANINAAKTTQGLVAQQMEVQFGQSITDALLQQSDIGLKASNVALGVAPTKEGQLDEATINGLRMNKIQLDAKAKLEKMNLKIKQFELDKLERAVAAASTQAEKDALAHEIARLEREVSEGKRDLDKYEAESARVVADIVSAGGSA